MIVIGYKAEGITIQYQTRRLSLEDANSVIQRCPLNKVVEWCGETGHNLVVWPDGYAAKMKKTISGYVVICCKKVN